MKILIRTDSTNPDYYADCECAVLDVTRELLARIAARVEIVRQAADADVDLCKLVFWECGPDFYKYSLIDACAEVAAEAEGIGPFAWEDQYHDEGAVPLPIGVDLDRFEPQRTERDQEIIRVQRVDGKQEFEVAWMMTPKHSNICIATEVLALDRLRGFATGEPAARMATAD